MYPHTNRLPIHSGRRHRIAKATRVVVLANETAPSRRLYDSICAAAGDPVTAEVVVVAPALNSRLRHWCSDDDGARRAAELRLEVCVDRLARAGFAVEGRVGDADPVQALADALAEQAADVVVVSTHAEGRSNWLARGVVERVQRRFGLPVVHVVADRELALAA